MNSYAQILQTYAILQILIMIILKKMTQMKNMMNYNNYIEKNDTFVSAYIFLIFKRLKIKYIILI